MIKIDIEAKLDRDAAVIVIDVGNTSTHVGTWHDQMVKSPLQAPTGAPGELAGVLDAHMKDCPTGIPAAVVVASVVPSAIEEVASLVAERLGKDALVVGGKVALPIDVRVKDPTKIGVDRVCAAAAAYQQVQTGCVVVDFGSAVTVDLVDDDGVLLGGAILPGMWMQLRALHEFTAALPSVEPATTELPYGRDTAEAMQAGVCRGISGAVRNLVEGYAGHLNRWPQVLATGGDLLLMMPQCDFIDTAVTDLVLRGVGVAYSKHIASMDG